MTDTAPQTGYASVNGLDMYYEVHGSGGGRPRSVGRHLRLRAFWRETVPAARHSAGRVPVDNELKQPILWGGSRDTPH